MLPGRTVNIRPASRREQAEWRRERLLEAALAVFGERGVEGATVKDIARAAGVSPGLIHHYFEGKEALVVAVIDHFGFLGDLHRLLDQSPDTPVLDVLTRIATGFSEVLGRRRELTTVFFTGFANPKVRAAFEEHAAQGRGHLAAFLASRIATGELREHDCDTAAQTLLAAIVIGQLTENPVDSKGLVDLLMRGLVAREGDSG